MLIGRFGSMLACGLIIASPHNGIGSSLPKETAPPFHRNVDWLAMNGGSGSGYPNEPDQFPVDAGESARNPGQPAQTGETPSVREGAAKSKSMKFIQTATPYAMAAGLTVWADRTGPGWVSESGWAMLGGGTGVVISLTGYFVGLWACFEGCPGWVPYLAPTLALIPLIGAAMAVQIQEGEMRRDRQPLRFTASMTGALLGAAAFGFLPKASHGKYFFILPAFGAGAVVGYRFGY